LTASASHLLRLGAEKMMGMSESAAELTALTHWGLVGDLTVDRTVLGTMNDVFIVGRARPSSFYVGTDIPTADASSSSTMSWTRRGRLAFPLLGAS